MSADGLCKRIIPCLDVAGGKTVKGINFGNLREIGDPVELGRFYQEQGADELTFLDISASNEDRSTVVDLVRAVAANLSIPFTVGGGVSSLDLVKRLLENGADKVSINTAAVNRPQLIEEIAGTCGSQCCVVALDVRRSDGKGLKRRVGNGGENGTAWEVLIRGGRVTTGRDALDWALECVERGAGEILLTSWDKDGTLDGFDIELTKIFSQRLSVPVIASGGARDPDSFVEVFQDGQADAALAASIFHDGMYTIGAVKDQLHKAGVPVRLC
ncbi:MAG TPA: imidazole glycerol phosphate synthase subunit HisF [Candidatus Obscuribacterales bacterium]